MSETPNETPGNKVSDSSTPTRSSSASGGSSGGSSAAPKTPEPAAESAGSGSSASATQATAAVTNAMSAVRERLQTGEQLALMGASLIVASYIIFQVILGHTIISEVTLLASVLMVLAIWVHRWGQHDFGAGYRIVIGALGVSLGLFASFNFLLKIRSGINADALQLIGILLFWAGGFVALYGSWMVFRSRE